MVTLHKLKQAHYAAAKIVQNLGDDYLIFFERIHLELLNEKKKQDLKSLAFETALKPSPG